MLEYYLSGKHHTQIKKTLVNNQWQEEVMKDPPFRLKAKVSHKSVAAHNQVAQTAASGKIIPLVLRTQIFNYWLFALACGN